MGNYIELCTIPVDITPSMGRRTMGIMEVMGSGSASVSQYVAITRIV